MTPAQRRVLEALQRLTADGWPATTEEVSQEAGHASRSTTWVHLGYLEQAGLVVRHPRNAKGGYMPTRS